MSGMGGEKMSMAGCGCELNYEGQKEQNEVIVRVNLLVKNWLMVKIKHTGVIKYSISMWMWAVIMT